MPCLKDGVVYATNHETIDREHIVHYVIRAQLKSSSSSVVIPVETKFKKKLMSSWYR